MLYDKFEVTLDDVQVMIFDKSKYMGAKFKILLDYTMKN